MTLTHKTLAAALTAASALGAMSLPSAASAQGYYGNGRYYDTYDACRNARAGSTVGGAVIGGVAGALLGNSLAGRHDRGAGTAAGAILGGTAGAAIGNSSAPDCRYYSGNGYNGSSSYDNTYRGSTSYNNAYPSSSSSAAYNGYYDNRGAYVPPSSYGSSSYGQPYYGSGSGYDRAPAYDNGYYGRPAPQPYDNRGYPSDGYSSPDGYYEPR